MSNAALQPEIWDHEIAAASPAAIDWLWHGFVASSNVSLLTSQWKAGKTTLLALLLARRKAGGALAGLAVRPGKSVVVSEEAMTLWSERCRQHDFGGQVCFITQPFRSIPRPGEWQARVDRLLALHERYGVDLAVIDPLAPGRCGRSAQPHDPNLRRCGRPKHATNRGLSAIGDLKRRSLGQGRCAPRWAEPMRKKSFESVRAFPPAVENTSNPREPILAIPRARASPLAS